MLSRIWGLASRRSKVAVMAAAALVAAALAPSTAKAADEKPGSAYSFSFGTDVTSHFISYGADVWGGGNNASPFNPNSTAFTYGTMTAKFSDNLSGFVNVWSDLNNNVNSGIGGPIQEVDINAGLTLSLDKLSVTVAHGYWIYAGDEEKILDLVVGYNDADLFAKGLALNPSVTVHWRYDGNGSQDKGLAVVPGIKPSFTFGEGKYPITVAIPLSIAIFEGGFQGGDGGIGFYSGGVTASVPLAFIPAKYGNWTASASATYYHTPKDQIPNNPNENFIVTALSV
ncbi:MAG TPA: hypothetical protein VF796_13715, partial [Humisphaera sp.]